MKKRLLTGWTFMRIIYLLAGILIIIQAVYTRQWLAVVAGSWFAAMGLFAMGCAAGNCHTPSHSHTIKGSEGDVVNFEEVK